jgi:hypothetical protein
MKTRTSRRNSQKVPNRFFIKIFTLPFLMNGRSLICFFSEKSSLWKFLK